MLFGVLGEMLLCDENGEWRMEKQVMRESGGECMDVWVYLLVPMGG